MAKISISMADAMNDYVQMRVQDGQYNNVSEYFRDLVRRDQEKRDDDIKLRQMMDDAVASGISERTPRQIMADIKQGLKSNGHL